MLDKIRLSLFSIAMICLLSNTISAKETVTVFGGATLKDQTIDVLTAYGGLTAKDLDVSKSAVVYGGFSGSNIRFNTLEVRGAATLRNINAEKALFLGSLKGDNMYFRKELEVKGAVTLSHINAEKGIFSGSFRGDTMHFRKGLTVEGAFRAEKVQVEGITTVEGFFQADHSTFEELYLSSTNSLLTASEVKKDILVKQDKYDKEQSLVLGKDTVIRGNVTFEGKKGVIYCVARDQVHGEIKGATILNLAEYKEDETK